MGDMKHVTRSLGYYVYRIKNKDYFKLIRFGDGEWMNILGKPNGDVINKEMDYFPAAGRELKVIVDAAFNNNTDTIYGLQGLAERIFGDAIPSDVDWHNADSFHNASLVGKLYPFIEVMREVDVVFVGPEYLREIYKVIPYVHFIPIPEHNCYLHVEDIIKAVQDYGKPALYSFSASIAANIIIYHLNIKDSWLLDLGSLWDPYVQHKTRSYHHKLSDDIIKRNLTGE